MVANCQRVWREISNYLEDDIIPELRSAMEAHFGECERCRSVLEGTRNVIALYGDERMIHVPLGYSYRLRRRLEKTVHPSRRSFLGWMVAATAAALVAGTFELGRSSRFSRPELRSEHAQPGSALPPDMMVVVSTDGKIFHASGCQFIHDKARVRIVAAREAIKEGYVPCVRCMRKYLQAAHRSTPYPVGTVIQYHDQPL
jgi:hypothetical protein